jgi:hypothetical protein
MHSVNSLTKNIEVELTCAASFRILLRDNGCGFHPECATVSA